MLIYPFYIRHDRDLHLQFNAMDISFGDRWLGISNRTRLEKIFNIVDGRMYLSHASCRVHAQRNEGVGTYFRPFPLSFLFETE